MSDKVTVDIAEDVTDVSVTEIPTSVTISDPTNTITVEENTTTVNIAPVVTTVTATEQVTTVDISENLTTVGIGDASITASNLASTIQTTHDSGSWITGANVQTSLDNVATTADSRYVNVTGDTMTGNLLMSYGTTLNFTAAGAGQNVYTAMNLSNNDILGVNRIKINDAGQREGIIWPNWGIFESPIPLANNNGNFIVAHEYAENEYNPILEVKTEGIDVTGTITFDGGTTSAALDFPDQVQARFGNDGDLRIYHDSNASYIDDQGVGSLYIRANDLYLQKYTGANYFSAIDGGATTLFYNGNTTLATTADGADVTGEVTATVQMEAPLFKGDLEGAVHFKASGSGLAKGDVVYISGYAGQQTTVAKADASDSAKMPAFGIVNATQGNNNVDILTFGSMLHLSTTGIATGTELYVSATTPGGYETSAPTGEGNLVQKIAKVVRGDSNSGSIKIMGAGRTNATPNLNNGNIFIGNSSNISTTASFDTTFGSSLATRSTSDLSEGTNLYYTDARADARISNAIKDEDNMGSNSATHVPSQQSVKAYVDAEVAGLVNGAPDDLNTLHELADALAEDASFSATVTTSIGNKLAKASNLSDLTNAATARTNLGLGTAATINFDGEYASLNNKPTLVTALSGLSDVDATTNLANDKILKYNSTDSEWQVADDAGGITLTDISVNGTEATASGDGGIAYDNTTGVFQYTPPTAAGIGALTSLDVTVIQQAANAAVSGAITSVTYDGSSNTTTFVTGTTGHGIQSYHSIRLTDSSGDMTEGDYDKDIVTILHFNVFTIEGNLGIPTNPSTVTWQPLTDVNPKIKITDSEGAEEFVELRGYPDGTDITVERVTDNSIQFKTRGDLAIKDYLEQIPGVSPSKNSFWVGGTSASSPGGTVHYSTRITGNTINGYASAANNNASFDISSGPTAAIYINGFGFTQPQNNVATLLPETGNSLKLRGSTNGTYVAIEDFKFDRYNSYIDSISYRIPGATDAQTQYIDLSDMRLMGLTNTTEYFTKELSDITLQIGETRWQEITMRPGPNGVRIHHNTEFENVSGETLRFHTTNRGIHVGDNTIGTYTAGDLQSNADTDFGMLAGRESTNTGSNNFGFGYKHSFGTGTASNFAAGSLHSISSAASYNNFMAGGDNKLTVAGSNNFCGGVRTDTRNSNNFTWAEGVVDGSNYYRAKNYGHNCALFGKQTEIDGNCTYSLVGGDVNDAYEHTILEGSHESILWGQHQEMATSFSSISVGQENDIQKVTGCAIFGSQHSIGPSVGANMNGAVIGGYGNDVSASNVGCFGSSNDLTAPLSRQSLVGGASNLVEGPYNFCAGQDNNSIGESAACIGKNLKTPLFQPVVNVNGTLTEQGDFVWDNYSTVVGAYNDESHKYHTVYPTDGTVPTEWVEDHRFVVGTGTGTSAKANGFIVALSDANFSGIIMPALAASNPHTSNENAKSAGVPVGGLYRDANNNIKIVT